MQRLRLRSILALLFAFTLVAAACGDDDAGTAAADSDAAGAVGDDATAGSDSDFDGPQSRFGVLTAEGMRW